MSLEHHDLWLRLVSDEADPYARMAEALARQIGRSESDEIVEFLRTGTNQQKKTALTILLMLRGRLRDDPALFSEAQRHVLTSILLGFVQQQYPLDERAKTSFLVLWSISPEAAGNYLADLALDPSWDEKITDRVLRDMAMTGNRRSFDRVQELSQKGGFIGERATYYLEELGYISPLKLQQIGHDFRQNPDCKLLNQLYFSYISHQVNKPIEPILKLLGTPREKRPHTYIYNVDGIQLYMEDDAEGRLVSLKLK
jgi:hypothetical protein